MSRPLITTFALALCAGSAVSVRAADVTWDNGSGNFQWDTVSLNWGDGGGGSRALDTAWNNAGGDGAIFGLYGGVGPIDVVGPINVNSLHFVTDGFVLNGTGSLNIVNGSSTQTTAVANVVTGATAVINVPINSALGFQKIGAGTLELNAPLTVFGGIPLTNTGLPLDGGYTPLRADLLIGGVNGNIASGVLRVGNSSVIDPATRVGIANGRMDIGSNNITLSELTFVNQTLSTPWDPVNRIAAAGVMGSGTLRVLGDINVIGVSGGNQSSNTIACDFDLGGGTQIIRTGVNSSFGQSAAIQFTGTISNGSLIKTIGVTTGGTQGSIDGIGLFGNNTYTGDTILNTGNNVVTGTNASSRVQIAGIPVPIGGTLTLQGANGSYQSATVVQAFSGGILVLDNNAALGASGNNQPNVPASQNNNRLRDDVSLQLRDGQFTYRNQTNVAGSETIGSLSVLGGHNVVNITANGTGSSTVTVANDLTLAPRADLVFNSTTLGAASKVFVNGSIPAGDATGILPRMSTTTDFVTYNGTTGVTPFTGYTANFTTPGTNVSIGASSTVSSSVSINALKSTATQTTTINAGQTLNIASGMMLSTSGTATFAGPGTVDFGNVPGMLMRGTVRFNGPVSGSQGIINGGGTLTLAGDLSGLTGTITTSDLGATTTLSTGTFSGALEVRGGTLSVTVDQTAPGLGAIHLGVPESDDNLIGLIPTLSFSTLPVGGTIDRDIIVDNGGLTAAGLELGYATSARLSPRSNTQGSQTLAGDVVLHSPVNLQGGAAGGTGATNFTGDISGESVFIVRNGRAVFTGDVSNEGGFTVGAPGNSAQATFKGTASGSWPIRIETGNNCYVAYESGALSNGPITFEGAVVSGVPSLIALEDSTISNPINFTQSGIGNAGAGVTAEWAGPTSGTGIFAKYGAGKLILSGASTHSGITQVSEGTLDVETVLTSASVHVYPGGTLGGNGAITGPTLVDAGGFIGAGASIGTLDLADLSVAGTIIDEIDLVNGGPSPLADLLDVSGSVDVTGATLALQLLNAPVYGYVGTFLVVANDGVDAVTGTFASVTGLPGGYSATIDYGFTGVDALGRIGTGNDIAISIVPAPSSAVVIGLAVAPYFRRRR